MSAPLWPYLAAPGLLVGVIARGIVWRLAVDYPPRHACPACGTPPRRALLPARALTGRCPHCGAAASQPPLLLSEVLCAAGFAMAGWTGGGPLRVAALCWLFALAVPAVLVDAAVHRLPDLLTWPCLAGVLAFSYGQAELSGTPQAAARTLAAGAASAGAFLVLGILAGVGMGDAKLAASLGAALGYASWSAVVAGLTAGICLAGLYAAAMLAVRRSSPRSRMPLGPPLLAGAVLVLVLAA